MTEKKQFVNSKGDTWEYEETEEMRKGSRTTASNYPRT